MQKYFLAIFIFLMSASIFATENQIGVVIGSPTGLSFKHNLSNDRSFDVVLSYSLADTYGLVLHGDYLVEKAREFNFKSVEPVYLYYGIGIRFDEIKTGVDRHKVGIGPRAPIGLSMDIYNPNIQIFGELALALDLIPSMNLDAEGGVGIRYRF